MRMRKKPNLIPRMERCAAVQIRTPEDHKGRWAEEFSQYREIRLELGCGKGRFTCEQALREPDVLLLDLAPGTGDMAISVAQALPNAELVVVTTPQPSASDIAVRSGLVALQVPMKVRGVVENMSYYEHKGEKLRIFGEGGGQRVSEQLTAALGHDVPLMAQLPLMPELRETGEEGRPAVLTPEGALASTPLADEFTSLARQLMELH